MRALLIAEWLRLRRRLDLWLVLGGVLGLVAFSFLSAGRTEFAPIDPSMPPDLIAEIERQNAELARQMAQVRDRYLWPWSLIEVLGIGSVTFFGTAFVAVSWLGSEYTWGTIRNVLLAEPRRGRVFAARVSSIGLVALGQVAALLVLGAILPAFLSISGTGNPPPLSPIAVAATAAVVWLWAVAFAALGILAVVVTRSAVFAFVLATGYAFAEQVVANLGFWQQAGLAFVPKLFLLARLTALRGDVEAAFGTTGPFAAPELPAERLDPLLGLGVLVLWIVGLLGLAAVVFVRADIRE
ncbi:MAG TPA: ABC transporter permease subunit [Candidatus Binatia bacterium]|nr:ABC transporter permease subunit [Candidatus Binatia bacterium]